MPRNMDARAATDDYKEWLYWFVSDTEAWGRSVTADLLRERVSDAGLAHVLLPQEDVRILADLTNRPGGEMV